MSKDDFFKKSNDTSKDKKRKYKDGHEHNSSKYITLRPTMEELVKQLGENILLMDEIAISEGVTFDTSDIIVDITNEDFDSFLEDLPRELHEVADELFDYMLERMDEIEFGSMLTEVGVLNLATRRRKAALMRRHRTKIMQARKRAAKRRANSDTMERRASRKARSTLRDRYTGSKKYHNMSPSEKLAVDKRMSRVPKSVIKRMTNKMMPQVRKTETERLSKAKNKNSDKKKVDTSKSAVVKSAVNKVADRVGLGTVKKLKEEITVLEQNVNINSLFESEFKKNDLPKK